MQQKLKELRDILDRMSIALSEEHFGKDKEAQAQIWKVRDEILILESKIGKIK